MKFLVVSLISCCFLLQLVSSEVYDAENFHFYDDDDDESMFSWYFADYDPSNSTDSLCGSGEGHCIRKREVSNKPEVETVGFRFATVLQYRRLEHHFEIAGGKPKVIVLKKKEHTKSKKPNKSHDKGLKGGQKVKDQAKPGHKVAKPADKKTPNKTNKAHDKVINNTMPKPKPNQVKSSAK